MNALNHNHVAILGLGMMGGSLGMALKAAGNIRVSAYARRDESRREALSCGAVDHVYETPAEAVSDAGIVVLCTPVLEMERVFVECRKALSIGAVVTDVGSTKEELAMRLGPLASAVGACFIGSHPVCGSDRAGLAAARADLYEGARVVVTVDDKTDADASVRVESLWTGIGAIVSRMTPEAHDRMFAITSHLPHLAAAAIVAAMAQDAGDNPVFTGTGFRDTTRIAQGSADVWHDIIKTNATNLDSALTEYMDVLQDVQRLLRTGRFEQIRTFLSDAAMARKRLLDNSRD